MPVAHWIVKAEVSEKTSIYVFLLRCLWRHNNPLRINPIIYSFFLEVWFCICWPLKYPEHRVWHLLENVHPDFESQGVKLVELIEVSKNEFVFRKPIIRSLRSLFNIFKNLRASLHVVVKKVRMRHVNALFTVEFVKDCGRWGYLICNYVIDVVCAGGSTETHELDLDWRWSEGKCILSCAWSPSIKIKQDMYVFLLDELSKV